MSKLRESMTPIKYGIYSVRIWRQEELSGPIDNQDLINVASQYEIASCQDLADLLIDLPRVNAVEVLDVKGFGVVLYNNWP
jgi:hypothetical protein